MGNCLRTSSGSRGYRDDRPHIGGLVGLSPQQVVIPATYQPTLAFPYEPPPPPEHAAAWTKVRDDGIAEIICIKSVYNNKYLRLRYDDAQTHGLLQFSGENPIDANAQFEVIKDPKCQDLVHIKSHYTNKYLVRWSPNHYWITASATEPNEDQSSWACTLFKPIIITNDGVTKKIRLVHVQLGHYACLWRIGAPFDSCLFAGSKDTDRDSCDLFTITVWNSFLKLPLNAAFKGDNGKYLGAVLANGVPKLQFSFDDPRDPKVAQQVFTNPDGTVCIKSKYYGKFWRLGSDGDRTDSYIRLDINEPRYDSSGARSMFRPNHIGINVVALLNMGNTWYCRRYTADGQVDLLNANTRDVDKCAILEVTDLGS